jgi:hypothetical protein
MFPILSRPLPAVLIVLVTSLLSLPSRPPAPRRTGLESPDRLAGRGRRPLRSRRRRGPQRPRPDEQGPPRRGGRQPPQRDQDLPERRQTVSQFHLRARGPLPRRAAAARRKRTTPRRFEDFQQVLGRYPNTRRFNEIIGEQYRIASALLDGARGRMLWGSSPASPTATRPRVLRDHPPGTPLTATTRRSP